MSGVAAHAQVSRFARCERAVHSSPEPLTSAHGSNDGSLPASSRVDDLWREYHARPCTELRDELVAHYMGSHVKRIAERMKAQLPRQVEVDDLVQVGYLGLVESMKRFDPAKQVKFETYSSRRIFGAMRDYLRQLDPVPRLQRRRERMLQREIERFQKVHGRRPSVDELPTCEELPESAVRSLLGAGRPPLQVQWSAARTEGGEDGEGDAMDAIADPGQTSPEINAAHADLRRWITRGFTCRDRLIIILYYYERMTMKEIGHTLGISESRVSQRLDAIIDCFRSKMLHTGAEQEFVLHG